MIPSLSGQVVLLWLLSCLFVDTAHGLAAAGRRSQRQTKPRGQVGGGGFSKAPEKVPTPNKRTRSTIDYVMDTSDSMQELLAFLDEEECEGLAVTNVGFTRQNNDGRPLRGIFAKEAIQPGEYICAVPFVSTLLVNEQFMEEEKGINENLMSSSERIEHGLSFWNNFLNPNGNDDNHSKFKAYLACLPKFNPDDPNFDATPEFWTDSEIRQLEVPSLVQDMLERKQALHDLATQQEEQLDRDTLKHASWIVRSRAFTTLKKAMTLDGTMGLLQRTVLIPYFDFLNHCTTNANAEMQVVETKEYDESFYALIAKKLIPKGQEIRIVYGTGQETCLDLFAKYGFLPQGNTANDREFLLDDLATVEWTTALAEDEDMLQQEEELSQTMQTILSLRIYLKRLQRDHKFSP